MRALISGFNSNSLEFGGIEFENSGVNEDAFSLISNYGEFAVIKMSMSDISSEVWRDYSLSSALLLACICAFENCAWSARFGEM